MFYIVRHNFYDVNQNGESGEPADQTIPEALAKIELNLFFPQGMINV